MPRLRTHKKIIRQYLEDDDWKTHLTEITNIPPREAIGPLLSLLLLGAEMTHRAAIALGLCLGKLSDEKPEDARNIMRRFMWHMNEESGNIGWGIPEAFAEALVHSPRMAKEFYSVLLSYIMDTGRDDNFCDHDILRRSCFWAVGRLASVRPELCQRAVPWLLKGLNDEDIACRGMAAWALGKLPKHMLPELDAVPLLKRLAHSPQDVLEVVCIVFDDEQLQEISVGALVQEVLLLRFSC